ncbi:MAG TPA: serpin family protein [Longimicrobiales bacterium]|nr:serpin family protein [Longimicrobiales bacterium]
MRIRSVLPVAAAVLAACSSSTDVQPPVEPVRDFTTQEMRVAGNAAAFGFDLLREVHASAAEPNVLLSPLSASMALGMTMNGAAGATLDAMRATLGFGGMDDSAVNAAYRGLISQLRARDPKVEFRLANSLWHERTFAVEAPFIESAQRHFDAKVTALDFSDPASVSRINNWAADATGNRIRDLLDRIDPLERLFLVNAVYFKAPWSRAFEPASTRPRTFRTLAGADVQVPTMMRDAPTRYFMDDAVQMVELPYGDSAFSMVLLMPTGDGALDPLIASLDAGAWSSIMQRSATGRVLLYMPKFRFDFAAELNDPLASLGMGIAFDSDRADFSRINPQQDDLYITKVKQKAFIDVHELGTEAAAATSVGVGVTSMPPTVEFDRPFLFVITERDSGAILFIGRVGDPR